MTIPTQQNRTYQFIRNNLPLTIDGDGQLLVAQVNQYINNVVDKSRLVMSGYGGQKPATYRTRNVFDAVWLFKANVINS